jgi:hypothetical protein
MYNDFLKKVKENCKEGWAHDVEAQVTDALQLQYNQETRRHTQAVRQRRKKKRMSDHNKSDENESGSEIDANNDLSIAFAQV